MKIRISNNSIRFRLKQKDVNEFSKEGKVAEVLAFGLTSEEQLHFTLAVTTEAAFSIQFQAPATDITSITLYVPEAVAREWTTTDLVGFEETIDTGKGTTIKILVEKDFACIDRGEKENEGTYPNPKANC